jgi:nicotinamide mononucleotide transporter
LVSSEKESKPGGIFAVGLRTNIVVNIMVWPIEFLATCTSIISIWLNTKKNPSGWLLGVFSVCLSAWVYYKSHLFAECGLQLFFFISGIYGWIQWNKAVNGTGLVPVQKASDVSLLAGILIGLVGTVLLYYSIRLFPSASQPLPDAAIASFSIVAQIWLAKRWIENWILWMLINIASICLYIFKELWFFTGLYGILLLLAIHGYLEWKREFKKDGL